MCHACHSCHHKIESHQVSIETALLLSGVTARNTKQLSRTDPIVKSLLLELRVKHSDPVQSHQFIAFRQCNRESSVPLTNHSESNLELNASFGHSQTSSQITSHQINNRRTPRPLPRCPNLPEDPSNKHAIGESKKSEIDDQSRIDVPGKRCLRSQRTSANN